MLTLTPLLALNYGLRGAAIALLLLVFAQFWRDARHALAGRLGCAFALSAAAYALYFSPGLALPSAAWHLPLSLLAQGGAVVFWLLASALLDDDFQLRYWHGLVWLAVGLLGFVQFFVLIPGHSPYRTVVATVLDVQPVVFALLGVWQAVGSWKTDLIERRRHFRGLILVAVTANILLVAMTKLVAGEGGGGRGDGAVVSLVEALAASVASFWVLLHLQRRGLEDWWLQPTAAPSPVLPVVALQAKVHPVDESLMAALDTRMSQGQIYREEDLSIGSLAQRMGVQEYQLRRLINQGLGYRNFNAFINHYRLEEAKAALTDPAKRSQAVLNIAMDCGFGSLGPFNRAFKAQTGMTPTEFRKSKAAG